MTAFITANALESVKQYFIDLPETAGRAASMAINDVMRYEGMAMLRKGMRQDIDFKPGYLEQKDKLAVTQTATPSRLEGVITGRDRPTSLASFAVRGQTVGGVRGKGVRVKIKAKGGPVLMPKAFLQPLRNGNIGLAVRLPDGVAPRNTVGAKQLTRDGGKPTDVWLLYGPSVDQVLKSVSANRVADISTLVFNEFNRQFTRLNTSKG